MRGELSASKWRGVQLYQSTARWTYEAAFSLLRAMQTLPLGRSELRVSRLAYGCWRIARTNDAALDQQAAREAIVAALEAGYTLFDLADIYCGGRAEEVFGHVLRDLPGERSRMIIATKCGIRFQGDPAPEAPYRYDASREYVIQQCDQSLRRLGVEYIDLFQLHRPDWLMDPAAVADAFRQLLDSGKVHEFGVSNFSVSQVELLQSALPRPLVSNQIEISLCQLSPFIDGSLDLCLREKITPLAWSPLGGGLLADGATEILRHQRAYRVADLIGVLNEVADVRGEWRDVIALAWLLQHPSGIIPIIGSTRPTRIHAAARAAQLQLTREEWYRLLIAARGEPLP